MNLWSILGLPVSFVILAALLLWTLADKRIKVFLKLGLITATLWFGLVLWHTPGNLMGWPKEVNSKYELPRCVLIYHKIIYPQINPKEAGIYVWLVPKEKVKIEKVPFTLVNPKEVLKITLLDTPRAYKIPYTVEEHKELADAVGKSKEKGGIVVFEPPKPGNGRPGSDARDIEDDSGWEALTMEEVFKKENE